QCSGTWPGKRRKPTPARARVAAASPAISGAGARTTVSAPSSAEKGRRLWGSNPPASITIECANSCVALASRERASESLPQVPLPVKSESRPLGNPPMPVRLSTGVPLNHGWGGGSSAALVSAWLPKRTRIESMANSSFCPCILQSLGGRRRGQLEAEEKDTERMFAGQEA